MKVSVEFRVLDVLGGVDDLQGTDKPCEQTHLSQSRCKHMRCPLESDQYWKRL